VLRRLVLFILASDFMAVLTACAISASKPLSACEYRGRQPHEQGSPSPPIPLLPGKAAGDNGTFHVEGGHSVRGDGIRAVFTISPLTSGAGSYGCNLMLCRSSALRKPSYRSLTLLQNRLSHLPHNPLHSGSAPGRCRHGKIPGWRRAFPTSQSPAVVKLFTTARNGSNAACR